MKNPITTAAGLARIKFPRGLIQINWPQPPVGNSRVAESISKYGTDKMKNIDKYFMALAAILGVVGMAVGLYMAAIENFKFSAVHAHFLLFGWASLALFGLAYRAGLAKVDAWAKAHFWVSAVGAILFPIGEWQAIAGQGSALAAIGSLIVFLSMLQFVVAIFRA
jgi:hypothetical protein